MNAQTNSQYIQAQTHIKEKNYEEAAVLLEECIETQPTPEAYNDLAVIHYASGNAEKALGLLEEAIQMDNQYLSAYKNAGKIYADSGIADVALGYYAQALQIEPHDTETIEDFLILARNFNFAQFNPHFKALYINCMNVPEIDFSEMGASWFSLLKQDTDFKPVYKKLNKNDFKSFYQTFQKISQPRAFLQDYFILGLKRSARVCEVTFESFLTHMRHALLKQFQINESDRLFKDDDFIALTSALAHYCYSTEYVFNISQEENEAIEALIKAEPQENTLAVIACYRALYTHPQAADILSQADSKFSKISDLINLQIQKPFERQKIKTNIKILTELDNTVSAKVKEQYEESPYPRWITFPKKMHKPEIEGRFVGKGAKILVAGCGTGREAVALAHVFPDAKVLAVDLSSESLAYGISRAKEIGIKNIEFGQADILKLRDLDQKFDYIACSGVLHHMKNPEEGWDVITDILNPGGVILLCLYSRSARDSINVARNIISEKNYKGSEEDIREFRSNTKKLLNQTDYQKILKCIDYYSMSECRDLLFHVQEHQFDIPDIKEWFEAKGMNFLSFYHDRAIFENYLSMFPDDPSMTNLDNWHKFEKRYSDTFISMYRMWAEKK